MSKLIYAGYDEGRGPSGAIWTPRAREVIKAVRDGDLSAGRYMVDDFNGFGGTVTTNVGTYSSGGNSYISYEDSGGSIAQLASERDGVIRFTTDNTDNDENWLMAGGIASVHALVSDTAADLARMWFECRVRFGSVADSNSGYFIGLGEEGLAAADTIADAGTLASKDLIGFHRLEGDGDALDTVYRKAGQNQVTVGTDAKTIAASTWYKLGMVYDPFYSDGPRLFFYVDGVRLTDYVDATTLLSTFPDGEELAFLIGGKNATTTATTFDLDWWMFAQEGLAA